MFRCNVWRRPLVTAFVILLDFLADISTPLRILVRNGSIVAVHWSAIAAAQTVTVQGRTASHVRHAPMRVLRDPARNPKRGPHNEAISSNWSGYAVTAGPYTSARGTWTVPQVFFSPSPALNSPSAERSSTWVGIGGAADDKLIQLGTAQEVSSLGSATYYAWYEMLPAGEIQLDPAKYPVLFGDVITASLQCTAACTPNVLQTWTLAMNSSRWANSFTITVSYASSLASAEWIMEAVSFNGQIAALPNYGSVTFSGLTANGANPNLSLSNAIILEDPFGQVSTPSAPLGGNQFTARFSPAPTFSEFPTPMARPNSIATGQDGALWFTENSTKKIGRITTAGTITEFPIPTADISFGITAGPDGNLWFAEFNTNKIGRITTSGVITEFPIATADSSPHGITAGPDGNLWFTEFQGHKIGRITTSGLITEFPVRTSYPFAFPRRITTGPDGNLWFTEGIGAIGRITTSGVITEFPIPTANYDPQDIASGPDGNLWFAARASAGGDGRIGRITTSGIITEFPISTDPAGITAGPDGALWFTESGTNKIGRITTSGIITEFPIPTANSGPQGIATGPDGALWFTESGANKIGRLGPAPSISPLLAATLPSSRSVQVGGNTATAFATILNTGPAATSCGIVPVTSVPANFLFQTTDPSTNLLTGSPNTRVSIASGAAQTYLLAFTANAPFAPTNVVLGFDCSNIEAVGTIVGVNTLLLTFDGKPVPDMIAVGVTLSNDGYSRTGGPNGTGIFVIAATNIGVAAQLTVRVRRSDASMPLTATVCETDSQTAQCKVTPAPTATRTINQNENTTWTAFLQASGIIAQDAAHNRVYFEFVDANGIVRGSTSTAVTTQ